MIDTKEFTTLISFEEENIGYVEWMDDNSLVWLSSNGLIHYNIQAEYLTTLKENCNNFSYYSISKNPEHNSQILMSRFDFHFVNNVTYRGTSNIIKYDILTGEEWLLEL